MKTDLKSKFDTRDKAKTEFIGGKYFQISYSRLQAMRWIALGFYALNQLIAMSQYSVMHSCLFSISYLTNWGYLLCFIFTYILLQTRLDESLTTRMGDVFHILLSVQFLITGLYWGVIFPNITHDNAVLLYIDYVKHIFPMFHMFLEFLFNNIVFGRTSFRRFKLFILAYMVSNFVLVRLCGLEIYHIINWRGGLTRLFQCRVRIICDFYF